jgi:hypothetical protein
MPTVGVRRKALIGAMSRAGSNGTTHARKSRRQKRGPAIQGKHPAVRENDAHQHRRQRTGDDASDTRQASLAPKRAQGRA